MEANNSTAATEEHFAFPNFVAYNVIMLVFFAIPVSVVNTVTIVALLLDKTTAVPIRMVIVNLLAASLTVILGLYLEHLTSLALIGGEQPLPPVGFCSFMIWLLAGGGASRLVFTATFSVVVFIIVKGGAKAVSKIALAISLVCLWIATFLLSSPILSPFIVGTQHVGEAACFPAITKGVTNTVANTAFVMVWAIIFGIIPLVITVTMPLVTICYIQQHSINKELRFKKAMVKFALFLIMGILFNFLGQVVPPVLLALASESVPSTSLVYLAFTLMNLSLIPTPVLIYIYLGGVRKTMKEILLCYPIRGKSMGVSLTVSEHNNRSVLSKQESRQNFTKTPTTLSIASHDLKL